MKMTDPIRNLTDGLRKNLGLSCRCVDGAVRQQCAVHLPFERQATVNGGFPILPTGSTDPLLSSELGLQMSAVQRELPFAEQPSHPISLRSGHPRRDVGLGTMTAAE